MASRLALAKLARKASTMMKPSGPVSAASTVRMPTEGRPCVVEASRASGGNDSGSTKNMTTETTAASPAAKKKGSVGLYLPRKPPMTGPKVTPRPMAAPRTPMPPPRCSSSVVSAM